MSAAAHIHLLPTHVANKIAAGEVVDRPASIVKELLENALDAGATQVDVEIVSGGRKLVAVRDNGSGMDRDDALLSVERQATSKIRDVDDIERISTLGFRGEALAAIASVSRFRLVTRVAGDEAGTELLISGGKIRDVTDTGCPVGTSIEVRDIFFNVPARRKFLRTHQTELGHVRAMFILQALGNPAVGMSLKVDGRETYALAPVSGAADADGCPLLDDRLRDLFGSDYLHNLRSVNYHGKETAVRGFVSLPALSRSDRGEQFIFVNGRATSAPLLNYAIREGYQTLLPKDRHPSVFLFLAIAPDLVDVNVHPTKKEVRFRHPSEVRDTVIAGIREALGPGAAPVVTDRNEARPAGPMRATTEVSLAIEDLPPTRTFRYPRVTIEGAAPPTEEIPVFGAPPRPEADGESGPDEGAAPWTWCRVIGQVGSLYVLLETEDGYVTMDPHAAHERVLFERYLADLLRRKMQTQALLMPETIELQPKDAIRLRKNMDLFKEMGFGISEFGADTFVVDALPAHFADTSARSLLAEIALTLEQAGARGGTEEWRRESIARAACKSAVKARDKLTLEEIEQLVVDLAKAEMPYTCPHGRPTLIFTSFKELNRKFGRS